MQAPLKAWKRWRLARKPIKVQDAPISDAPKPELVTQSRAKGARGRRPPKRGLPAPPRPADDGDVGRIEAKSAVRRASVMRRAISASDLASIVDQKPQGSSSSPAWAHDVSSTEPPSWAKQPEPTEPKGAKAWMKQDDSGVFQPNQPHTMQPPDIPPPQPMRINLRSPSWRSQGPIPVRKPSTNTSVAPAGVAHMWAMNQRQRQRKMTTAIGSSPVKAPSTPVAPKVSTPVSAPMSTPVSAQAKPSVTPVTTHVTSGAYYAGTALVISSKTQVTPPVPKRRNPPSRAHAAAAVQRAWRKSIGSKKEAVYAPTHATTPPIPKPTTTPPIPKPTTTPPTPSTATQTPPMPKPTTTPPIPKPTTTPPTPSTTTQTPPIPKPTTTTPTLSHATTTPIPTPTTTPTTTPIPKPITTPPIPKPTTTPPIPKPTTTPPIPTSTASTTTPTPPTPKPTRPLTSRADWMKMSVTADAGMSTVKPSSDTRTAGVTPTTAATVKPVTAAATVKPVTTAATVKPVTTAATVKPVTTAATVKPVTAAATVKPVTPTVKPVTAATVKPVTTAATVKPVTTTVKPVTPATVKPVTPTVKPVTAATVKPVTTTVKPVTATPTAATVKPVTAATVKPVTTTVKPVTTTVTPTVKSTTTLTHVTPATAKPTTTRPSTRPIGTVTSHTPVTPLASLIASTKSTSTASTRHNQSARPDPQSEVRPARTISREIMPHVTTPHNQFIAVQPIVPKPVSQQSTAARTVQRAWRRSVVGKGGWTGPQAGPSDELAKILQRRRQAVDVDDE